MVKELEANVVDDYAQAEGTTGVTLNTGPTRLLKSNGRLLALLDGPYPQNPSSETLK